MLVAKLYISCLPCWLYTLQDVLCARAPHTCMYVYKEMIFLGSILKIRVVGLFWWNILWIIRSFHVVLHSLNNLKWEIKWFENFLLMQQVTPKYFISVVKIDSCDAWVKIFKSLDFSFLDHLKCYRSTWMERIIEWSTANFVQSLFWEPAPKDHLNTPLKIYTSSPPMRAHAHTHMQL